MKQLKRYFYRIAAVLVIGVSLCLPVATQQVSAQNAADQVCAGIATASGSGCNGSNTSLNKTVRTAINIFSTIIGIVAVVMVMVSGFKYITAGGDAGKLGSAKNTLIYAVIGLVIVALAQSIVRFVLDAAN